MTVSMFLLIMIIGISVAFGYMIGFWIGHFAKLEQFPKWVQKELLESGWYDWMKEKIRSW